MTAIWQSVELQRLGWALLHSLWQGAAICALAAVLLRLMRHKSSQFRYLVACSALGAFVIVATGTVFYLMSGPVQLSTEMALKSIAQPREGAMVWFMGIIPKLPVIWAVGVLVFSVRLFGGWCWFKRDIRLWASPAPAEWRWRAASLSRTLGIPGRVRILVSQKLCSPMAIGWIKPLVLLPASALLHLPPDALEAILAHELAHIRRRDFLVNLVQSVVEVLFFYHPAVWWLSGQICELREHCCDDEAAKLCGSAVDYASALAELETLRGSHATPQLAHAANGASLMKRIQRILSISQPVSLGVRAGLIAAAFLSMVGAGALWGFSVEAQQRLERQRIIIKDGSKSVLVNMQGDVKLDSGSKNGLALGEGASLVIAEKGDGITRRLDLRQETSGLKTTYSVDGQEKPLDAEGQAWLDVQVNEIKAVEAHKSSLAPKDGGTVQFEISEDGKDGAGSKVIVYSNGRSPIIWNGQPILSGDLPSVVEAINKINPEELQKRMEQAEELEKRVEQARKFAEELRKEQLDKSKAQFEELRKRIEESKKNHEIARLKLREYIKEQSEKNKKNREKKQNEKTKAQFEELRKRIEESKKNHEIARLKLREYVKEQSEKNKKNREIARLKQREQIKEPKIQGSVRTEELRKWYGLDIEGLPAQDWKNLELFPGIIKVFPAELREGPSLTPEAKKQRIEEELKRLKARVEQLEEELKKSEAK
ncbi:MAG: M48 family metalloprotease [Holophagales bacterium]|jgi:beta-lactamase regulating signal transducer with metallopeptidase domain|nr:M48 family metalloprotease [Holophagales bacterium]